jgi:hypothetical protein
LSSAEDVIVVVAMTEEMTEIEAIEEIAIVTVTVAVETDTMIDDLVLMLGLFVVEIIESRSVTCLDRSHGKT